MFIDVIYKDREAENGTNKTVETFECDRYKINNHFPKGSEKVKNFRSMEIQNGRGVVVTQFMEEEVKAVYQRNDVGKSIHRIF